MLLRVKLAGSLLAAVLLAGCGGITNTASSALSVVAGENFWGSLAAQLGGSKVSVHSVVTDPNADPHEYESSADDARAFADARLVILNGAGYDGWAEKLLNANPAPGRRVFSVAGALGKKLGDNPHFWYSPDYTSRVADEITAQYKAVDSADAAYFDEQRSHLKAAFEPYVSEIAAIKQKFAGTAVGSTESIFAYMADALGLSLTTPIAFMNAVSEGNDPPAASVAEFQNQISGNKIKVLVYNVQTSTALTTNIKDLASSHHIPRVGVSETMQPQNSTFQDWQLKQLQALEHALESNA